MTRREEEILAYLKEHPLASLNEVADAFSIAQSSAGVHISNLMKKGAIRGKGYIFDAEPTISVIGGANVDFNARVGELRMHDSIPGDISQSYGGVARNIAENLAKLGNRVSFYGVVGNDTSGDNLIRYTKSIGVDCSHVEVIDGYSTGTYLSITERDDMAFAVNDMSIYDVIDESWWRKVKHQVLQSDIVVLDTNYPISLLKEMAHDLKDHITVLDTVSLEKAKRVSSFIGLFHTIKPNRIEAELLTGITITDNESMQQAAEKLIQFGVEQVFISMGRDGIYYQSKEDAGWIPALKETVVNVTGAGDAFVAGLVTGMSEDLDMRTSAKLGRAAATITILSEKTIHPELSRAGLEHYMEESK